MQDSLDGAVHISARGLYITFALRLERRELKSGLTEGGEPKRFGSTDHLSA